MAWKPEYAEARRKKAQMDPEYRAKRNAQSTSDKEARKVYMADYYKSNPEKFPGRTKEQRDSYNAKRKLKYASCQQTRAKVLAKSREWQAANPEKRKAQRLKKYQLTPQEHAEMLKRQMGVCAICGTAPLGVKMFPMVDHCHKSGKVRGLLCSHCNMGLGKFKDSRELLQAAINYLAANLG